MNTLQIFNSSEFGEIRTLTINNEPYFVGKDVADKLGYRNGSRDVNRHVDEEDRTDVAIHDGRQRRNVAVINESGLYALIFGSKLDSAKRFKRWVTSEVLPAIRKTGSYRSDKDCSQLQPIAEEKKSDRILFYSAKYKAELANIREEAESIKQLTYFLERAHGEIFTESEQIALEKILKKKVKNFASRELFLLTLSR